MKNKGSLMGLCIALGVGIGVAIGVAMDNIGAGIISGVSIGIIFAIAFGAAKKESKRLIHKGATPHHPHQLDNGPTKRATLRINHHKYSQTTPGKTVATPAYNRALSHAIHHAHHSPK